MEVGFRGRYRFDVGPIKHGFVPKISVSGLNGLEINPKA